MLRYSADRRTLVFIGIYFALLATGYAAGATGSWATAALVVLTSLFSFFGAVITHNTVHAPVFRSRRLNRAFQVVLTCVYGHPVSMFVPGHNLSHHRHTQTPRDLMRTSKVRWRLNALNVLLFTSAVTPAVLRDNVRYARVQRLRKPVWFRQLLLEAGVLAVMMVALLWLDWRSFLAFVIVPHQFAQWGIVAINFPQHDGCDATHPYDHSRNFTGALINWFTFNNGFHGMHHVKPGLHWSLLPEAHAEKLRPHVHPSLDHQSLLGWAWKNMVWPGRRLDYLGNPMVFPEDDADISWVPGMGDEGDQIGAVG